MQLLYFNPVVLGEGLYTPPKTQISKLRLGQADTDAPLDRWAKFPQRVKVVAIDSDLTGPTHWGAPCHSCCTYAP